MVCVGKGKGVRGGCVDVGGQHPNRPPDHQPPGGMWVRGHLHLSQKTHIRRIVRLTGNWDIRCSSSVRRVTIRAVALLANAGSNSAAGIVGVGAKEILLVRRVRTVIRRGIVVVTAMCVFILRIGVDQGRSSIVVVVLRLTANVAPAVNTLIFQVVR